MKLFFDHHLSPKLIGMLADIFPAALHVRDVNLHCESDEVIWRYARDHGLSIVTKDSDFHQMSFVYGHPPKVIWLRCASVTTGEIASLLRASTSEIKAFHADEDAALLVIS